MACYCGAPGRIHERCGAEWKRRAEAGMCVMCAREPALPDEHKYWCAGCDATTNRQFFGYSPLGE